MRLSWFTTLTISLLGCSKTSPDVPTPSTPVEDVVTPVAGVYRLTKVTASGGTSVVTGAGSLTIAAIDKTTAGTTQIRSFTNTATGGVMSISSIPNEANKLAKSGGDYVIKSPNGNQWATVSGSKLITNNYMATTTTSSLTLTTEYTK